MLGLRLADGIDPGDFPEYKETLLRRAEPLRALGFARRQNAHRADKKGFSRLKPRDCSAAGIAHR